MKGVQIACTVIMLILLSLPQGPHRSRLHADDLALIKPDVRTGFSNAGWKYDRYKDLPSLDAHTCMTVADLKGPGIIRHIHMTRHHPEALAARGVVLEIWFDNGSTPAVMCPVADFFGDGCNGNSMYFSTRFIECAPWSYNCYFPMPFKERARVFLRNDTDRNLMDYSYVEWERLPEWKPGLGTFHATYWRKCIQLTRETDEMFFEVQGAGHLVGRQYSVATDEPLFRAFHVVMEGNNEVDIDGRQRHLDYLGTEDSFTFSWGFKEPFAGLRAGMPFVEHGDLNLLSIYRFHDHMPIRFNKSLRWHINWREEHSFTKNPVWTEAVERGGCWVDYATVYYWYLDEPGGFEHEALLPVSDRSKVLLRSSGRTDDLEEILKNADTDPDLENTFSSEEDLKRIHIFDAYPDTHPFWIDEPGHEGGHPGNPNPGRRGILAVHARSTASPCWIVRKVRLPERQKNVLRIVVSGDPYENPGKSDFILRAGIFTGERVHWFAEEVIVAGSPPSESNWRTLDYDLGNHTGQEVCIVLKVSHGGPFGVFNEEAFFDEISVKHD